jgi:hypothetical protein
VAEEKGKVDLRCCGRSRFRTWLVVYKDRRWSWGGGDVDEEWPCSDVGHWVNTSALWREELKTCGIVGGRAPPLPEALLWVTKPEYIMLTALLHLPVVVHISLSSRYLFLLCEGLPALVRSRDRVFRTVTSGSTIPASNPSRSKRLFSSRLTSQFHLLLELRMSGAIPPLSHLPSRDLQGQLYFSTWFGKFLLNSILALNSTFWVRLLLTRVFWIPRFSCFRVIKGRISFILVDVADICSF